jgi:hypothetical protein
MPGFTEIEQEHINEAAIICEVSGYYPAYYFLLEKGFDGVSAKLLLAEPERRRQHEAKEDVNVTDLLRKK